MTQNLLKEHILELMDSVESIVWVQNIEEPTDIFINKAIERYTGIPRKKFLTNPEKLFSVIHPDDLSPELKNSFSTKNGTDKKIFEYRIIHKNQDVFWFRDELKFVKNREGQSIASIRILRNITPQREATRNQFRHILHLEWLAEASQELLDFAPERDIYEFIGESLKTMIGQNAIITVNSIDKAQKTLTIKHIIGMKDNYSLVEKLLGRPLIGGEFSLDSTALEGLYKGHLVHLEKGVTNLSHDIPYSVAKQLSKILNLDKIYSMGISRNNLLYGSLMIIMLKGGLLENETIIEAFTRQAGVTIQRRIAEEKLVNYLHELENIVEKRTARLNKINEELKESNALKTLLLDILTHDIRNPASVISGVTELLLEGFDEELYNLLKAGSDELLNILEEVTNLAAVTIGDKIHMEKIDLVRLTEKIILSLDTLIKENNIQLSFSAPKSLTINANPVISTTIRNYLANAIRYTLDTKKIDIELGQNKKGVWCEVRDYGTTIPENERKNIFDRHIRLGDYKNGGQGLGLAIVKRIANAHGAVVGVRPNLPVGNIFYIQFLQ